MKQIDPEKTELALGLRRIDIRTASRRVINTDKPEWELRQAKIYWLKWIQPYIAERKLRGAELFIAQDQYRHLKGTSDYATRWNETEQGRISPVPAAVFPDWKQEEYREPEELLADENLKPAILAGIAATLVKTGRKKTTPNEAVREAHELLLAAERHLSTLPKKPHPGDFLLPFYAKVTFEEILQSNEQTSRQIPLLPPVQKDRNEGRLKMNALKMAVRRFLQDHRPNITKEEFELEEQTMAATLEKNKEDLKNGLPVGKISWVGNGKTLTYEEWQKLNQDSIDDILDNNRISASLLSVMRWERFRTFSDKQQGRAEKRRQIE